MSTFESATARLSRLLTMVPWLLNRQGIDLASAAAELGVSEQQVVDDLQVLFVCGTPGHYPDDLIDAQWEGGKVFVSNADTIARPLRLGRDEALALVVALRALAHTPGLARSDAVERALAKLEQAAGDAAGAAGQVSVDLEPSLPEELVASVRRALTEGRRVHLRYHVASRDETTERDVDPLRVVSVDGRWYLEGWCHRARGVRLFRLDRVEDLQVLDAPSTPPADLPERDLSRGAFLGSPDDLTVTLHLEASSAWVAESFPVESVTELDEGRLEVEMRVGDPRWLHRLVRRQGGGVRVVGPPEVVAEVVRQARAALDGASAGDDPAPV
ncbi:WYL domain-containing protein [Ornithinimicrobium humiphilum]|uniref:Proteasome accessory factor C n=1 Tax=Ornithinimicrobium humiphilum TaxID=125288 RepID=A0A543KP61_9MICO|nr:WYL domain-containing protein [Ornithinimicrobium humiphilum]TQM96865.1 proteasome accessory factor C [Ornithinimicrobium humiphilum]